MEISYKNNLLDGIYYLFHTLPRSRTYQIFIVIFLIMNLYLQGRSVISMDRPFLVKLIVLVILVSLAFIIFLALLLVLQIIVLSLNKKFFAKKTVQLTEEGVKIITLGAKTELTWQYLKRIDFTQRLTFFYTDDTCAFIIPNRAFASEDREDDFLDYAEEKMEEKKKTESISV